MCWSGLDWKSESAVAFRALTVLEMREFCLDTIERSAESLFVRLKIGRFFGLFLFIFGLLQYRSYNRQFLGLWSYSFALSVLVGTVVLLVILLLLPRALLVDLALLSWGLAYFLDALDSRDNGANVKDLIFFGSSIPAVALLEWITLVLLFIAFFRATLPRLEEKWSGLAMLIGTLMGLALLGEGFLRVKAALVAPAVQGLPTFSLAAWNRRYVKLNSEGFRDVEHPLVRDPARSRMLIVGDSFAFGWGIPRLEDRIGEQVASRLAKTTGKPWEVINASRPNSDTLDEIGYLNQMTKFKPDLVILIYIFNDIDYLIPHRPGLPLLRNRFVRLLWQNSYLFQEMFVRIRIVYYRYRRVGPMAAPVAASGELTDSEFAAYANPTLMARHLADIARFASIAQQSGARILVVPYDLAVTLQGSARDRYKDFLRQTQSVGIPVCSLEHTWDGHTFRELTLSPTDGHPNEGSIRMAADAISTCLLPNVPDKVALELPATKSSALAASANTGRHFPASRSCFTGQPPCSIRSLAASKP
jgi:hypothetical protein